MSVIISLASGTQLLYNTRLPSSLAFLSASSLFNLSRSSLVSLALGGCTQQYKHHYKGIKPYLEHQLFKQTFGRYFYNII